MNVPDNYRHEVAPTVPRARPALIDAHVHFYPTFDETRFLEDALANVRAQIVASGLPDDTIGWLLFSETSRDHAFEAFASRRGDASVGGWSFWHTAEAHSLLVRHEGREVLGLVAGRQIITREGLEVLALGTVSTISDGGTLDETLERVRGAEALPVLPWGFGKWTSRRGALVERYIRTAGAGELFVGDNGGRLSSLRRPRLLRLAEERDLMILPGSDPLPIPGQEQRVASFGFVIEEGLPLDRPAEVLKARLRSQRRSPPAYGKVTRPAHFVRNQIFMQLRKHGILK